MIGSTGGSVTGPDGKGGGVPILAEPLKLVMPLVVLFVSWEVHVLAAHDPMFVVMV